MTTRRTQTQKPPEAPPAVPPGYRSLSLTVSPQIHDLLNELLNTGMYGFTIEETAERLIARQLIDLFNLPGRR
jgi:hypothetical protein